MKKHISTIIMIVLAVIAACQIAAILILKENYVLKKNDTVDVSDSLVITEVCSHNYNIIESEMGECSDYIELYNNSLRNITLSNYYITNGSVSFKLPEKVLTPHEYVIVWGASYTPVEDEEGNVSTPEEIFCGFDIKKGDTVVLSIGEDVVQKVEIPKLGDNESYSVIDNKWEVSRPTPMAECTLSSSLENLPNVPSFSKESGFYDDDISLKIKADKGCTVYYTLDASTPTTESTVYDGKIKLGEASGDETKYVNKKEVVYKYNDEENTTEETDVPKARVVRAIAVDEEGRTSNVVTATYFIGKSVEEYKNAKVISLVSDPDSLYGDEGIMVTGPQYDNWYLNTNQSADAPAANFTQKGVMWEREASVELFENGKSKLNQDCGIRLQGQSTRAQKIKRLSIYSREMYSGSDIFATSFFDSGVSSHSVVLRTGAMADVVAHSLLGGYGMLSQDYTRVVCFLDGEYYTTSVLREKYDANYFKTYCDIDEKNLVVLEGTGVDIGTSSDYQQYLDLIQFVKDHDMADADNYESFLEEVDVDSFIEYMVANIYLGNLDVSLYRNVRMFKTRTAEDSGFKNGKWHWLIYDMDAISWANTRTGDDKAFQINSFNYLLNGFDYSSYPKYINIPIFSRLLKNEDFKMRFVNKYFTMMYTVFNKDNAIQSLEDSGLLTDSWREYFTNRASVAKETVVSALSLDPTLCEVSVDFEAGYSYTLTLGNRKVKVEDGRWSESFPVGATIQLEVVPEGNTRFKRWEGDIEAKYPTLIMTLDSDLYLNVTFK